MTGRQRDWACWALRFPDRLPELSAGQWEPVIRHARRADLLARLAVGLQSRGELDAVPAAPRLHLQAALNVLQAHRQEVRHEVALIADALRGVDAPVVLLKGAAYLLAGLPAAQGRLFSDVDILVPRDALVAVETALRLGGWMGTGHDAYDERYYREWMHELPPMTHLRRGTTLDVHHNILPSTVRQPPDAALLLSGARRLPDVDGLWVLSATDMVLHSMTHLFHNDELSHALRDLSDLDLLLRQRAPEPGFWAELSERARLLHLRQPLAYGLWATHELLGTPVPDAVLRELHGGGAMNASMRWLWRRVLRTDHVDTALPGSGAARFALYVRAHWLRMPPVLLARHLATKARKRWMAGHDLPARLPPVQP